MSTPGDEARASQMMGEAGGKKADRDTVLRTFRLMLPYKRLVAATVVLSVVVSTSTLVLPILSGQAIDAIVGEGNVDLLAVEQKLAWMAFAIAVTSISQWFLTDASNRLVYDLTRDLRTRCFDKIQHLPLAYLDAHPSGDLVSRVVNDIDMLATGLLLGLQQLLTGVLTIILTLVFMFRLDPYVTLVALCITPLSFLVATFIARKSYVHFGRQNVSRGQLTALVEETIGGIATVRDYDAGAILCKKFDELDESFRKAGFKATFFSSCVNPSTRFVNNLIYAGVCLAGAIRAVGGFVTVGDLSAFLSYANQYTKPFNDISAVVSELQGSFACSDRVFQLLDQPEVDPDPEGAVVMGKAKGAVEIKDVRFSYVPGREVLHGIKLSAKPGQTIAIVGPTGCGKTTLINLLMRFYDADSGTISVDGVPIEDVTRTSLRANWGMVLQDAWVAGGTVRDNICMGRPDATDEEVRKAAEAASASAFIERLPNGYDTVLEPGGKGLSAGQRQLLCIARVMLARPAMLILDEATSSIDTRTELRVQEAMGKLMEGRTSFVVAHRLSTIRSADLICAMRDGRVVETGTHEELLAKDGFYASLYRAQFEAA